LEGIVRCIVWPEEFAKFGTQVQADSIVALRGAIDRRAGSDEANVIVNEIIPLAELGKRNTKAVLIRVVEETQGLSALESLREIVRQHPGNAELQLSLALADGSRVQMVSSSLRVEMNVDFRQSVDELLGPGNCRAISAPKPSATPPRQAGPPRKAPARW
jgi:DNA polymerase-3 subunit alpha